MHIPRQPYTRAALAALAALAICFGLSGTGSRSTPARAASIGSLQRQINAGNGVISGLAGQVRAASRKVDQLGASISNLEREIARIQADLVAKRAELFQLRSELQAAQTRLNELRARQAYDEQVLARQLVSKYESDTPDLVTVVLESRGFQDLLERIAFQQRISKANVMITQDVKAARRAVTAQAIRLGALEVRQQNLTEQVLQQRNRVDQDKVALVQEQLAVARSRDAKASRLASARDHVANLRSQLHRLIAIQQAQAAAAARAAQQAAAQSSPSLAASSSPGVSIAPSQVSSAGGFTFPLPKGSVVPPGSWSPDDGVDMAAPGNTPEFAVCSGTIVLHGIGGFGPWAPVLHCDSSLAGYSYVYYGHAGPADQLAVGTHVSAGQVMSSIGPGIVGISTGPHLEIGFCDASGTPIGPSSAGAMMSLLRAAY